MTGSSLLRVTQGRCIPANMRTLTCLRPGCTPLFFPAGRGGFSLSRSGSLRLGWQTRHTHTHHSPFSCSGQASPIHSDTFPRRQDPGIANHCSTLSLQNWGAVSEPAEARPASGSLLWVSNGAIGTAGSAQLAVCRERSFVFQIDNFKPQIESLPG